MYHPNQSARATAPPFGPPPPHIPSFRLQGACPVPPPGHLPPGASDNHYLHNRPPRGHYIRPHCSNFSIDRSTVIALGGSQQIVPPAETPHLQVPQWTSSVVEHHHPDNSDRAGEEFLRCIAANKPLPNYLKGNMAYNLADAFKSANVLKEAVKSDPQFQKHVARSKSRSRTRSRGRSRGRSRARSRPLSKSQARSRSRGRSKSHVRGKSHARSKSRARSRSRSQSRSKESHIRSKSRVRRSKSRSSSGEQSHGKDRKRKRSPGRCARSNNLTGNSLLEGLKLVMNSKDLEDRLPTLKEAILTIQASDESKRVQCVADKHSSQQHDRHDNSASLENDSMLLPHERVGSDFSWLQEKSVEDISAQKANELEDEESFLYGTQASSQVGHNDILQEMDSSSVGSHQNMSLFSSLRNLLDPKQTFQVASSAFVSSGLGGTECEKVENILNSLGASSDVCKVKVKTQGAKEGNKLTPALLSSDTAVSTMNNPNVRKALESLQSLIKATKEKRTKSDEPSQTSSDKVKGRDSQEGDREERKREKQAKISQMGTLAKELEELFKQDGLSFLSPVIGFYCQKCEEFIGDLNSAEKHAAIHCHSNSNSREQLDKHGKDSKGHSHHHSTASNQHSHSSERGDHREHSHHRNSGDHRDSRDFQRNTKDAKDHRSTQHADNLRSHRAGQENIYLKEEMKKEMMLITVSRGLTPPAQNIRIKEEVTKEQAVSKDKSSKSSRETDMREKTVSSASSDDDKSPETKQPKKKKKKKKERKKKKDKS
ncbi:uncharacterized protein [Leuresthes tenuis]|uniref:uncharacterized protein isoform X2 n=1 Tax=Leuresthes tenuis TaxID=355514 RepID=UPI003B50BD67